MLRHFRTALGFLTIFPVSPSDIHSEDLGEAVKYFPLVGVVYGCVLWGVLWCFSRLFSMNIAAWLTTFIGAALNGLIHWDGFADTADGLGSRDPQKSLLIMKDSRLGAFGAIALGFLIFGKVSTIAAILPAGICTAIIIFSLSRWVMALQICTQPWVSQGLLQSFTMRRKSQDLVIATFFVAAIIIWGWWSHAPYIWILLPVILLFTALLNWLIKRRFGGITGDILGASNELIELIGLLILNIKQ